MTTGRGSESGAACDRQGHEPVGASQHSTHTPAAWTASSIDGFRAADLLDGSPIPTFVVDADHVVLHMNRACADLLGIAVQDVTGKRAPGRHLFGYTRPLLAELVVDGAHAHDVTSVYGDRCRALDGIPGAFEGEDFFPQLGPNGRWLSFRAVPLRDRHGALVGAMETVLDISATRCTEGGHAAAAPAAGQRQRDVPAVTEVRAQPIPARMRAAPGQWQRADLCRCIESALDAADADIRHKADVVRDLVETPAIECRAPEINQVIRNLLVNACQAIGAQRGTITIRNGCDGDQVWFEVEDTGSGIDKEQLPRIFEPYFTTQQPGEGRGRGLSISAGIVRQHQGRITVRTVIGHGSAFRVTLPITQADARERNVPHAP
ncbi:ATP-binding protein [Comamonadaceae bacterium G21597-S1]|nr:ATP-binding protein [Comamonadaceae bacterium G21597-S1]